MVKSIKSVNWLAGILIIFSLCIFSGCKPMEDCDKEYVFTGTVLNNLSNPEANVDVIFLRGMNTIQAKTGADGKYTFQYKTKGNITSYQIGYNVSGLEVATPTVLTDSEVVYGQCGAHSTITRNVTLP